MKEYDLIVIGSGSAMSIVERALQSGQVNKVAIIDKDEPGGICLTRGCIPSKIMLYPAELVASLQNAEELGINVVVKQVSYEKIMKRMRNLIDAEIEEIRQGLSSLEQIDFYNEEAEFSGPYTLKVGNKEIKGKTIILATGSKPYIPQIKGLDRINYHTSDSIIRMQLKNLPRRMLIVGGGYIAAEFGFFFSVLGSEVTVIGRNEQFLPDEEPEVSFVAMKSLSKYMKILTGYEVFQVEQRGESKIIFAKELASENVESFEGDEILLASGREPNTDILHAERAGIKLDDQGWIIADEYLQTTQQNIWVVGDADGKYMFRHVANYEADIVYQNAFLGKKLKMDYHAVPHAVFTYPEVASVGIKESEAVKEYGEENIAIGFERFEDTAKGEAMNVKDYFVKVIVHRSGLRILGAHIVGPYASILVQEIINVMNTRENSLLPIFRAMHIHPALSEVVQRACGSLMSVHDYHHLLKDHLGYLQ